MLARSAAVFHKDLISEFRTRYAINAILLFAITTLVAVSFAIGGAGITASVQASLLWIMIYFSSLSGLSRVFVKEEESHAADALRLTAAPGAVFGGKLIFNLCLLLALEVVTVPLFMGMMSLQVRGWLLFVSILGIGSVGLAVASTIVAAIVARASSKGALFAVLAFPLLLPILIVGIRGTETALESGSFLAGIESLKMLVSYTGVMSVVSLLVFRFVWEE